MVIFIPVIRISALLAAKKGANQTKQWNLFTWPKFWNKNDNINKKQWTKSRRILNKWRLK